MFWDRRVVKKVLATGRFYCPRCGTDSVYEHIAPRRWFVLFNIPVIPLDHLARFVECTRCKGGFIEAALNTPSLQRLERRFGFVSPADTVRLVRPRGVSVDDDMLGGPPAERAPAGYDTKAASADVRALGQREKAIGRSVK